MRINEMPKYAKDNKPLGLSFIFCTLSVIMLIVQLVLMKRTAFNVIFLFLTPALAVGAYGFHGITMTEDRPTMLTLMPFTYFTSLLLNELIAVEVGAIDTYPYIPLLECIPLIVFCFSVSTGKLKAVSQRILLIWVILLGIASLSLAILAIFFNLAITHERNYLKATFAIISGFLAVIFLYLSMYQVLFLAGSKVDGIPFRTRRSSQIKSLSEEK